MNYRIKLNLLRLNNCAVTTLKGAKETKRCLVIPVDENHLYVGEKGVYLDLSVFEMREANKGGDTHLLKQSLRKEEYARMSEEERKNQPLLGSMKPNVKGASPAVSTGEMYSMPAADDADLPF